MASSQNTSTTPSAVSRSLLLDLAGKLKSEWLDVGRYLGVSDTSLHNVKVDNAGSVKEAKYQMLICWLEAKGQEVSHSCLGNALLRAGRKDLSDQVKNDEYKSKKRSSGKEHLSEPAVRFSKRLRAIEEPSETRFHSAEKQITSDMKRRKTQFVKELKKKYRNLCGGIQPVPFLRDKYDIEELFVESGIKFLEGKPKRGKEQEKWIGLESYKMVFTDPRVKSSRRIIDGEPGHGKSTLALQIAHDWCYERSPLKDVNILIVLRLRQFKNVPTIYSAIKNFLLPKDSKLTAEHIEDILDRSNTLILLDGYDEYPGRGKGDTLVELIIREEMCQDYDVILTTRTSCLPPDYSCDTKIIRLTGYNDTARDAYIRNVVARGNSEDALKIGQFFKDNPVPVEIGQNPLFFAMISFMVHLQERFFDLKTVTDFFRHIIKCFCTFKQSKATKGKRKKDIDLSSLNKLTFEGLCDDSQQVSWGKEELMSKIGTELYNEYVHIGLLIEENGYDYDAMEYKTETSFYHKLFVEWYAAHHLVDEATSQEAEFEPWPSRWEDDNHRKGANRSKRKKPKGKSKKHRPTASKTPVLKSLDPDNVHFMYRYACGLNKEAALKIIGHLGKLSRFNKYTMLCIIEWGGNLMEVKDTISLLCSRGIHIYGEDDSEDSVLLQKFIIQLLKFASDQKIAIEEVRLYNCLEVGLDGDIRLKPSNLSLPVIQSTFTWLQIHELGREFTEQEFDSVLQYASTCMKLDFLQFDSCLLPRYIKTPEDESMSLRNSGYCSVLWDPDDVTYLLNYISGEPRWEDFSLRTGGMTAEQCIEMGGGRPMTDEQYQEAVDTIRELAEADKE